ncbi:retropepsin-like aspartic protease [Kordiimonas laminariae]|uniref:retropepsin-like aspartic protease n=1 Tax=Kordiimonas laminariae TaxID=2917717 RepID=UPI001FF4A365|nr:aspartyl protease family protein [Kordiimonas laminariae]
MPFLLGLMVIFTGCSDLDNLDIEITPQPLAAPIVLKMEEDPRFPVVTASVNGKPGFRFVLDTGSTLTGLFMHEKAQSLGIKGVESVFAPNGSGEGEKPKTKKVKDVTIGFGELKFEGMTVLAFPASVSEGLALGRQYPIDGVIGYDLFSRYMVTFDAQAKTVTLSDPETYKPDDAFDVFSLSVNGATALSGGRTSFVDMPLAQEDDVFFDANLHLDTGSSFFLSLIPGSNPAIKAIKNGWISSSRGIQGKAKVAWRASTDAILLGQRLENIRTVYAPKGSSTKGRHGRIGHGFLKRFRYTVDYSGEKLIIEALEDSFKPYATGYTGISAYPHEQGMHVTSIKPNSPAEKAEVQAGVYTHVNGHNVAGFSKHEIDKLLNVEASAILEICSADLCYKLQAANVMNPPIIY